MGVKYQYNLGVKYQYRVYMSNSRINQILLKNAKLAKEKASPSDQAKNEHLSPVKHKQKDFFIADLFDTVRFKDDIASMEHPLFALKPGDTKARHYEHNNTIIDIRPSVDIGMATIHDKDIWIYCISKLKQAMNEGEEISRTVRFTIYDYLVTTNRDIGGRQYSLTKDSLNRLKGTNISIERVIDNRKFASGFGLIEDWTIIEEKDGRMIRVEITLPKWLYQSITNDEVLTISPDYFRLRKPLDRRIYELARKHCGKQSEWRVSLDLLLKKSGSSTILREFRKAIKSLAESNQLPGYKVLFDTTKDQVLFYKYENIL